MKNKEDLPGIIPQTFKLVLDKEWAEETLAKQPKISHEETSNQLLEFMMLRCLIYDREGNWIPQLDLNQSFEVKPVSIIDGKMQLDGE